jgi:hypothetical protein
MLSLLAQHTRFLQERFRLDQPATDNLLDTGDNFAVQAAMVRFSMLLEAFV